MILLKNATPIGKGTNRSCYLHPNDSSKCIKVTHSGDISETKREVFYYKFLKKQKISWKHIAQYYGAIKTDLGRGDVFELIRDYDGKISQTLTYYVQDEAKTKLITNPFILIDELKNYCLENKIIIKDLNSNNLICQRIHKNKYKLIIIDGLSNPKRLFFFNKFNIYFKTVHTKSWNHFYKIFQARFSFNYHLTNLKL
jgi:hypothetical protein